MYFCVNSFKKFADRRKSFLMSALPVISSLVQRPATGAGQVIWLLDDYLILAEYPLYIDSVHFKHDRLKAAWSSFEGPTDRPTDSFNVSVCCIFIPFVISVTGFFLHCLHAAENKRWDKANKMLYTH